MKKGNKSNIILVYKKSLRKYNCNQSAFDLVLIFIKGIKASNDLFVRLLFYTIR
jgi:hypothetical protein